MGCTVSSKYPEICESDVENVVRKILEDHQCSNKDAGDLSDRSSHNSYGLVAIDSSSDSLNNNINCGSSIHWTDTIEIALLSVVLFWGLKWVWGYAKQRREGRKSKSARKLQSLVATMQSGWMMSRQHDRQGGEDFPPHGMISSPSVGTLHLSRVTESQGLGQNIYPRINHNPVATPRVMGQEQASAPTTAQVHESMINDTRMKLAKVPSVQNV
jgi:hypothetical protein